MKKITISIILAILLISINCISTTANNEPDIQTMTFVHYAKGETTFNIGDETGDRYKTLQHDFKWPNSFQYQVDLSNLDNTYIDDSEAMAILKDSLNTWQAAINENIFEDPVEGTLGNIISWGDLSSGIIAQNAIQYNRITGDITASHVTFNTDYSWGDATVNSGVMDLQNIATHEFGHNGLRDLYDPPSSALTMFGYSAEGETNKRTLGYGDILGIQSVYGTLDSNVNLVDIDSGTTSPTGEYRWRDIGCNQYADSYRLNYDYTQANVHINYDNDDNTFHGFLLANNLKPNFAYQVKIVGSGSHTENHDINERIGYTGRWWKEEWIDGQWVGIYNFGDSVYEAEKDIELDGSPTGYQYKFIGYLLFDYFITNENGDAILVFSQDSSYHVLYRTDQRAWQTNDGPIITSTFDPETSSPAYDEDHPEQTISVYGQVERTPVGGKFLPSYDYSAQLILTEESFHGLGGTFAGNWAAAMGNDIQFTII